MAVNTKNYGLRKDAPEDFYDVEVVNANLDKIDTALKKIETEAKNKDGGNADTVDGKHASDFAEYFVLNNFAELEQTDKTGMFKIASDNRLGLSLYAGYNTGPDASYRRYLRIYGDGSGNCYARCDTYTAYLYDEFGTNGWSKGKEVLLNGDIDFSRLPVGTSEKTVAKGNHTHRKSEITDLPSSLPANGGNADTIGGKTLSEIQNYNNLANKPSSLPANGGNADTLGNLTKTDFVLSQRTAGNYGTILEWANAQNQSAIAWFSSKSDEPPNTVQGREVHYLLLKGLGTRGTVAAFQYGLSGQGVYKRQIENNAWYNDWTKINDGGNADTLDNKQADDFYQCDRTAFKSGETILEWANAQNTNTSKGVVMSNYPDDAPAEQEGTVELIVFNGNRKIIRFTSYSTKTTYVRSIFRGEWLTAWKKTEDGGNASTLGGKSLSEIQNAVSINKKIKTFTVQTGSWFRLARNNKDSCGGVFVLTIGSGSASSTTVFSAAQQYSSVTYNELKLKCLSHSSFNNCVTKLRAVNQSGSSYEQYIDFYIAGGTNGSSGDVEVQFFGKGWSVYDSIASANIASGYTTTEISLQ